MIVAESERQAAKRLEDESVDNCDTRSDAVLETAQSCVQYLCAHGLIEMVCVTMGCEECGWSAMHEMRFGKVNRCSNSAVDGLGRPSSAVVTAKAKLAARAGCACS